MWQYCVYMHRKASNGEPFYIGKTKRHKCGEFSRVYLKGRNKIWNNIERKHGFVAEIIAHCINDVEAQRLEMELIKGIGRLNLGTGTLTNLTDGGDGHAGIIASKILRVKRSKNASAPRSESWKISIRASRKNGGNGGTVKKGDKLPSYWKKAISKSKIGAKNIFYNKPTPISKRVVNLKTGVIYGSIMRAAIAEGIPTSILYKSLAGLCPNTTGLEKF